MQLLTLNIWGGKLLEPLLQFVSEQATATDVFCFQEMYRAPHDQLISRDMHADLFGLISQKLPNHQGFFAPHLRGYDLSGKVGFKLESGLAIFVRKTFKVDECSDFFIFRNGFDLENNDIATIPRNLQYLKFATPDKNYLISHFHGLWFPKTKLDTEDRLKQSQTIRHFLDSRPEAKLLCGDFNLLPTTQSVQILEQGMTNLITKYKIPTTRNRHYQREEKHADYVLVSPEITDLSCEALNVEVSDHLPVKVEFK